MMYPPEFPSDKDNAAEEQVFKLLKSLLDPARYDVFYGREFVRREKGELKKQYEIDFIIADISGGRLNAVLLIEVKGGNISYDGVSNRWYSNGKKIENPVTQVNENLKCLLARYPDISNFVPFGWAVCFPQYTVPDELPPNLSPLKLIGNLYLNTIHKQLPNLMREIREDEPYRRGVDLAHYERHFKEPILRGLGHVVPLHRRFEADKERFIRLTGEQMELLKLVRHNPNLVITGPAGSGKTVMATNIAREAYEEGRRVLLLTFNRIPAGNIRDGLKLNGFEGSLVVDNYHNFARRMIDDEEWWMKHAGTSDFWAFEVAAQLHEARNGKDPLFDVLIIDEGQDFRELWFESLDTLVKPSGSYYILMDKHQDIFGAFSTLPKSRHFASFHLSKNCRNTRNIINKLEEYIGEEIQSNEHTPEGLPVRHYTYANDVEQVRQLREAWLGLVRDEGISPGRIVLMLNSYKEESCLAGVKQIGGYPITPVDNDTGHLSPDAVNYTRIRTFKGLEADVVFILDTHKMADGDYKTAYTQASRARMLLGVFI